jgi:hypothetical protein
MSFDITHKFVSAARDSHKPGLLQPSNWNDKHEVTMATARMLGRIASGAGIVEELTASEVKSFPNLSISDIGDFPSLAAVAFSGQGSDLGGLAPIATSGSAADLSGSFGNITQTRIGGLWTNAPNFNPTPVQGVNIARFERVFVGAACVNDGTKIPSGAGADWLETRAPFTTSNAELAVVANSGRNAFIAAVRLITMRHQIIISLVRFIRTTTTSLSSRRRKEFTSRLSAVRTLAPASAWR